MELIHNRDRLLEILSDLLKQLDQQKTKQYPVWDPTREEQTVKEKIDNLPEAIRQACVYVYHQDVGMSEYTAPTSYGLEGYCQRMSDQGLWELLEPILNKVQQPTITELEQLLTTLPLAKPISANISQPKPPIENKLDERYELINTFQFTVPADYCHNTRLADFATVHKKEFSFYNNSVTDDNFAQFSNKLVPGQTYTAKIFQLKTKVTSADNLALLASQGAILVGAQGLTLVYQQAKAQFPVDKGLLSFDEKDKLWEDANGLHRVPYIKRYSDGHFKFFLVHFESDWHDDDCLLCVCD